MLQPELAELEERIQRLINAYRQMRLERNRALAERDRQSALNAELRRRVETVVERIRTLEQSTSSEVQP